MKPHALDCPCAECCGLVSFTEHPAPPDADAPFNPSMREAWALTHGERRAAYGTPSQVFAGYAKMWSGLLARKLREDLDANDVTLCMTALKLAREANSPKGDNITDAHGYLIMHDEIKDSCAVCGMEKANPQHSPRCPDDCGAHDFRAVSK